MALMYVLRPDQDTPSGANRSGIQVLLLVSLGRRSHRQDELCEQTSRRIASGTPDGKWDFLGYHCVRNWLPKPHFV